MTITIPPEALEAAARAICEAENGPCECLPDECGCTYWQAHARAAAQALLENWPRALEQQFYELTADGKRATFPVLILPLDTQENEQ